MASFTYQKVYIKDYYSIVGPYEYNGAIKGYNEYIKDFYNKEKSIEKCEISLQKSVMKNILLRNKIYLSDIDLVIGGDLTNQLSATIYNIRNYSVPFIGIYAACATFNLSLLLMANHINCNLIKKGICITSSHNLWSEKQFRFPIEYGSVKPERTTFTATAGVGCLVTNEETNIKVVSSTIGNVIDYKVTDAFNMGAAMAPGAAFVINRHFKDLNLNSNYYDIVLTGDLGNGGLKILKELLDKEYKLNINNIQDSGTMLYKSDQPVFDGASGPTPLPLVFFNKIIKQKKYKKILLIATGALHSPIMINQKESVPGISYAIGIEVK